ncbi:biopolymer transporter Tol [Microbacterium sp. PRC9]|uniref:biopolymer transporter Tol n=1 Tax=Microbacterium sp. PRC9 TaxID=2962591 RepID=UPI002881B678|nr:biopolymer transporter Tol [Microbacterium sp. PRC9]MDT0144556.1 biopolymer transporter Tol [Microbacterium sp. PRC9]
MPAPGRGAGRKDLQPGQVSQLRVHDLATGTDRLVLQTDELIEAPNWTPDDRLVVNGGGCLWQIPAVGGELAPIDTGEIRTVNNDHVLSPDGTAIYFSAAGHLYRIPIGGGNPVQVSNDQPDGSGYTYWLHGITPDGGTLAYVAVEPLGDDPRGRRNLATIPAAGGPDRLLSDGAVPFDGPEYSPDGVWLYYNSEEAARTPGHAQLFRMPAEGGAAEQLTFDERVNWFPHLDPQGESVLYISYEPGTVSHPADVDVTLRIVPASGGEPRDVVRLFGGQGTLNVNSWAPDSSAFAYVAYPFAESA